MRRPLTILIFLAMFALGVAPLAALSDTGGQFPGPPVDSRTLKIQEKAEALFEAGEYDRARFIYEHELAPIGDKYAQYMLGFMYLTGAGVEENTLLASAWYRLAAERGHEQFTEVRDQLLGSFSDADKVRSDEMYRRLRRDYSDLVILVDLVRNDMRTLSERTGSRLTGGTSPITVINPRRQAGLPAADYYASIERRLEVRVAWLREALARHGITIDARRTTLNDLEDAVSAYLEMTPDR